MGKKDGKPRGKMSSYAFFVQTCREEHKKKHPGENVVFAEFSKKCAERWKTMSAKEKRRFEEMAEKDKARYDKEMANYIPEKGAGKRKKTKDPNAPKRALSAFFFFCQYERPNVKKTMPNSSVGEIAKELGKRWEGCTERSKYEKMAVEDKKRYERVRMTGFLFCVWGAIFIAVILHFQEMSAYKKGGAVKKQKVVPPPRDDDDDDEEDEEEEDEDDEDDEWTHLSVCIDCCGSRVVSHLGRILDLVFVSAFIQQTRKVKKFSSSICFELFEFLETNPASHILSNQW